MRRILITGIGGDVACAIIRCIQDAFPDDEIFGIDIKAYTPYMDRIAKAIVAPRYTDKSYVSFLKETLLNNGITHFLPTTEPEILIASGFRSFFKEHKIKVLINNDAIIQTCTSKYKTAKFLQASGICVPMTWLANEYKCGLSYPFILKADTGSGSKKLSIIKNDEEWKNAIKDGMLCQELVGNPDNEYTVGVFSDGEETRTIIFRRYLGFGGMSVEVHCCDNFEIKQIASSVANIFNLQGCVNIQIRKQGNRYLVFEINPRLSSTVGFRHKMGFQDVVWWLKFLDGEKLTKYNEDAIGMIGLKVTDDIVFSANRMSNFDEEYCDHQTDIRMNDVEFLLKDTGGGA